MSILNILREPNKLLRQKSAEIHVIDEEIKNLAEDMLETMYNAPGIGLAAVQVGVLKRLIVVDISKEGEKKNPIFLINPKIIWKSDTVVNNEEGCLSIPGYYGNVDRYESCKIEYLDIEGKLNNITLPIIGLSPSKCSILSSKVMNSPPCFFKIGKKPFSYSRYISAS